MVSSSCFKIWQSHNYGKSRPDSNDPTSRTQLPTYYLITENYLTSLDPSFLTDNESIKIKYLYDDLLGNIKHMRLNMRTFLSNTQLEIQKSMTYIQIFKLFHYF